MYSSSLRFALVAAPASSPFAAAAESSSCKIMAPTSRAALMTTSTARSMKAAMATRGARVCPTFGMPSAEKTSGWPPPVRLKKRR